MKLQELVEHNDNELLSPTRIAEALHTTKPEIANILGLGRKAFSQPSLIRECVPQTRLREMTSILDRVEAEIGSRIEAYRWFRSELLPGFGDLTPEQLVRDGKAHYVHAYLDHIMAGGYA